MLCRIFRFREAARGFDDDLHAEGTPVKLRGIFYGENFDPARSDDDRIAVDSDLVRQFTQNRVVLCQMRESLCIGEIVDGDELDCGVVQSGTNHVAADPAETIDTHFYRHARGVFLLETIRGFTFRITGGCVIG
jgi:hypothetical protein